MSSVAVITPYCVEPLELLEKNHASVRNQTHPCLHVLVADGFPQAGVNGWEVDHVILPRSHGDVGSTPRLIGCYHAIGLGCDAVAFLDADNWYHEDHIQSLMRLRCEHGAAVVSSGRILCRLDGSEMGVCQQTDPRRFVDTNCMLVGREAFHLLHHWVLMPEYGHVIGDRIFWHHVCKSGLKICHSPAPTVYYRCQWGGVYRRLGEPVPEGVKPAPDYNTSFRRWQADGQPPLV